MVHMGPPLDQIPGPILGPFRDPKIGVANWVSILILYISFDLRPQFWGREMDQNWSRNLAQNPTHARHSESRNGTSVG